MTRGRFRWQRFAGAFAFSAGVHVLWVIPTLIEPMTQMNKAAKTEYEEVEYVPEEDLQDPTLPPPTPEEVAKAEKKKKEKKAEEKKPEEKKPPAVAELKPVPPPPPTPPPPQQPPPPPPPIDKRKQMVTQDQFKEEQDNANAKYLAEKNHAVKEDTRVESTNLVRIAEGAKEKSAENDNKDKNVGEKDQKIAELENHQGKDIARDAPQKGNEGASADPHQSVPGPLSMRNLVPRTDLRAELQQRDGVERQELAAGELPMMRKGVEGERGGATKKGGQNVNLNLDHNVFDNVEGFNSGERARIAANAASSHVKGRYDKYLDKVASLRSAMENFTPDVRVGNQAELGTRASPFAAYITAMHRQIHKFWTFGFLTDLEMRVGKGPFDDLTLWTQIQISLNNDGTIDKLGVIHASGNTAFDAAAIDCVRSAAPFPKPPAAIISANGKVYMDWQFHRNELACGTFGVDPHILTTPGGTIVHDSTEAGGGLPLPQRQKGGGTSIQNPLKSGAGGGG